jgi:predicted type IV restriction endonuclease
MGLERDIEDIRAAIKAGRMGNEAAVSQGVVLRLLHALNWPTYDTQTVSPQFAVEERRVDYALCHPPGKPLAFIEVKKLGQSDGAERQLFEYAFHKGVQLAILTDGQEWNFFLPGEQGDYGERRVYKLDIIEREAAECVLRLNRYLKYDAIVSGAAIEAAREDYRNVSRERQMKATLPQAWAQLVREEDDLLLELLADRVESLCGYKPDLDTAAAFLKAYVASATPPLTTPVSPSRPRATGLVTVSPPKASRTPTGIGFVLDGKHHQARYAIDVLVDVIEALTKRDPSFPARFASLPKHGRKRRYIAQDPQELYPGRPDLARDCSKQLSSGWWIGTNYSRATISRFIMMSCDVGHLQYGKDLTVELGE